ncbi:LysE/ArgO family amino acid transporter [Desulfovibrio inopinatus]|uniref:LysE/ArgO family amino acid transporter n=1 Tax=Desulfovibrio inopinatus TaxID=102109 RepID=UPI0004258BBD|nr:LysE/ArgO family amino acid transporter [Desulfovibrio inopinatus]
MEAFFSGFGLGAGLIIAIGAQNAFVLARGVHRDRAALAALICTCCDILLISVGVTGLGSLVASRPELVTLTALGGAIFLLWYGWCSLRSALQGGQLNPESTKPQSLRLFLATALAVSLLNPHAYLDTVVLLGGVSSQFPEAQRMMFGFGAMCASACWFFSLGLGGRLLAPVLRTKTAWRVLDGLICLTMWTLAANLLRDQTWG